MAPEEGTQKLVQILPASSVERPSQVRSRNRTFPYEPRPRTRRLVAACRVLSLFVDSALLVILYDNIFQDQGKNNLERHRQTVDPNISKRMSGDRSIPFSYRNSSHSPGRAWSSIFVLLHHVASCFMFHRYVPIRSDLLHCIVALSFASFADRRPRRSQHRLFPATRNHRWSDHE